MKSLNLDFRHNYDLFGQYSYEPFHWGKLYLSMFNCYYSTMCNIDDYKVLEYVAEVRLKYNIPDDRVIRIENTRPSTDYNEVFLIIRDGFCVLITSGKVVAFYNSDVPKNEVDELIIMGEIFVEEVVESKSIYMIKHEYSELSLERFQIRPSNINIESHYNEDFKKVHQHIKDKLTAGTNGIILLHGNYGTGKTYYIRHLINTISRQFVYFPINMMDCLSSPGFMPFLADHQDIVLILEDCESLIMKRE